jgi:hypothetical protein
MDMLNNRKRISNAPSLRIICGDWWETIALTYQERHILRSPLIVMWDFLDSQWTISRRIIKGRPFRVGLIVRINAYREEHPYE